MAHRVGRIFTLGILNFGQGEQSGRKRTVHIVVHQEPGQFHMICGILQYKSAFGENARMVLYIRRGDHGGDIFKIPVTNLCKDIILASIVAVVRLSC